MGAILDFISVNLKNKYLFLKKPKNIKILSILLCCLIINLLLFQNCMKRYDFKVDSSSSSLDLSSYEWHLRNTGELGGLLGQDINVESVWASSIKGKGINIAVVDTGIQLSHTDLIQNASVLSWNFANPSIGTDTSTPGSAHGTCVAGIIAAADNGYGVTGVAPEAKLIAYNIAGWTDAYEQGALSGVVNGKSYIAQIDVSNNSWGPNDNTGFYNKEESFWTQSIETGLSNGRSGLGTVYVWAAGNGGSGGLLDRSNYDGYSSYHGVVAVCAVGDSGQKADYSESGSNLWVCGYGGDPASGQSIVTTDFEGTSGLNRGGGKSGDFTDSKYTKDFAGTSAAAPVVSGIVGLILNKAKSIGKNLSWRDVKWILAKSAKAPPGIAEVTNAYGLHIYDDFGFGIADAGKAVELVSSWTPVGAAMVTEFPSAGLKTVNTLIPNASSIQSALSSTLTISANSNSSEVSSIEFVDLNINLSHPNWSELEIVLVHSGTSSSGAFETTDIIAKEHNCVTKDVSTDVESVVDCSDVDNGSSSTYSFRFGISRHLGESMLGTWELKIFDSKNNSNTGTLGSWGLKFYGE